MAHKAINACKWLEPGHASTVLILCRAHHLNLPMLVPCSSCAEPTTFLKAVQAELSSPAGDRPALPPPRQPQH